MDFDTKLCMFRYHTGNAFIPVCQMRTDSHPAVTANAHACDSIKDSGDQGFSVYSDSMLEKSVFVHSRTAIKDMR